MKVDFPPPTDGAMHRFCLNCMNEQVGRIRKEGQTIYPCAACGHEGLRTLYFNTHKWWLTPDKELWHEGAGVFVRNTDGKYLFFLRNEYPMQLAIPGGHVEEGVAPPAAAIMELIEETGLERATLQHVVSADISGDSCSAGADAHRWHAYFTRLLPGETITLGDESASETLWLTLDEALASSPVFTVSYLLRHHGEAFVHMGHEATH